MAKTTRNESTHGKIGRNERCPCGSGKKYKKCCLGRAEEACASATRELDVATVEQIKEGPGFRAGELRGYVLARALEEPRMWGRMSAADRAALASCTTPGRVSPISTAHIVAMLDTMGIHVDEGRLRRSARGVTRAWDLGLSWLARLKRLPPADLPLPRSAELECFLGLCAVELWRRLMPDRPCAEMLGDLVDEGYTELEEGRRDAAIERWHRAWQALDGRLGPGAGPGDLEREVCATRSITRWLRDLGLELCVAARTDPATWLEPALAALRSLEERPELDDWAGASRRRAELLFVTGRRGEAELTPGSPCWHASLLVCGQHPPPAADLTRARELLDGVAPHLSAGLLAAVELLEREPAQEPARARVELLRPLRADVPALLTWQIIADGAAAVPHLTTLLADEREPLSPQRAASLLGLLHCRGAVGPLLDGLARLPQGSLPWCACADALSRLGRPALEAVIAAHRWSGDPEHCEGLRWVLARMGVPDERVLALLDGGLGEDPVGGTDLLVEYGDPRGVSALTHMRSCVERDDSVTALLDAAIEALGGAPSTPTWAPPEMVN